MLRKRLRTKDRRIALGHEVFRTELGRLAARPVHQQDLPLRLIGTRETRSHNSWLHNIPSLIDGRDQRLRINPADDAAAGVRDGQLAWVRTEHGAVQARVKLCNEMTPGAIALPHGWGHQGGWKRAVTAGGVNANLLTSDRADLQDRPSGNAHINGLDASVTPVAVDDPDLRAEELAREADQGVGGVHMHS